MLTILRFLLSWLVRVLFRLRIQGEYSNPAQRPLLIIANHESFLDGLLLGLFLPGNPVFVVHTWVAENFWFRQILKAVDYLEVDPTKPLAIKRVIKMLESGRPVVIFPEGRITVSGGLMKIYDGPAFAAAKSDAFILPVCLQGTRHSYLSRLHGKVPRRLLPRITMTLHPLRRISMPSFGSAKQRRRAASEAMRHIMQEMLFTSQARSTLFSAFCNAMELHGRYHTIVEDIRRKPYNYQDLLKTSLMLSRLVLKKTLLPSRAKVGILLPNLMPSVALFLGLSAQGRIPAMLNYTAGAHGLRSACIAAEIDVIVSSRTFVEQARLTQVLAQLYGIKLLYLEDLRATISLQDKLWLLFWALWRPRAMEQSVASDEAAAILFTSGSEGAPKGVVLSHRALLANIDQVLAVIDCTSQDRFLNALPIFHSFGLTAGTLLPILHGCSLFLYPNPLHYRVIPELAYDRNCTILLGTSTFLGNYAKMAHPYDFFRIRYAVVGAEKLSPEVQQLCFEKLGVRVFEGYGVTETAPVLSLNTPMAYCSGTVGQLLPGIEYHLEPVEGLAEGGVLHVRGPNLMNGYLRATAPGQLEVPQSVAGPGWYDTGDIVSIDANGFMRIIGRVKRFAKIAGEMISLESVEALARTASPEAEHAVIAVTDRQRGETLVLFTTDTQLERSALLAAARQQGLAELLIPKRLERVERLPLLGTGKTDYVRLVKMATETAE